VAQGKAETCENGREIAINYNIYHNSTTIIWMLSRCYQILPIKIVETDKLRNITCMDMELADKAAHTIR